MKPHKHVELIKAWADGAAIECKNHINSWVLVDPPTWNTSCEYRLKPQPKPDIVISVFLRLSQNGEISIFGDFPNAELVYDGETHELKAVELIK